MTTIDETAWAIHFQATNNHQTQSFKAIYCDTMESNGSDNSSHFACGRKRNRCVVQTSSNDGNHALSTADSVQVQSQGQGPSILVTKEPHSSLINRSDETEFSSKRRKMGGIAASSSSTSIPSLSTRNVPSVASVVGQSLSVRSTTTAAPDAPCITCLSGGSFDMKRNRANAITPGSSILVFPSTSTLSAYDNSEPDTNRHWATSSLEDSLVIGLPLETMENDEGDFCDSRHRTSATIESLRDDDRVSHASPCFSESSSTAVDTADPPRHTSKRKNVFRKLMTEIMIVQLLVLFSFAAHHQISNKLTLPVKEVLQHDASILTNSTNMLHVAPSEKEDCIYVPGGGFSGFWFTLGRLSALSAEEVHQESFVCYSAGCLGVVATLLQHLQHEQALVDNVTASVAGYEDLYAMARDIQVEWLEGSLHRYEIVETFIDRMMSNAASLTKDVDEREAVDGLMSPSYRRFLQTIRNNLYIVTSVPAASGKRPGGVLDATLLSPRDMSSLKRMLLQTTWIPMAVGSSFSHQGHLDGAFTIWQHPSCRRDVGLVVPRRKHSSTRDDAFNSNARNFIDVLLDSWKLWSNTLNVNLGKQSVEELFRMGLEYGV